MMYLYLMIFGTLTIYLLIILFMYARHDPDDPDNKRR